MTKYYNNIECDVIAELPNGEVAITFITGYYNEYDSEYGSYSEPIETTLVVQKKQLTDKPITRDDIVTERENMLKEINKLKTDRIQEANIQIRNERAELEKELKNLRQERDEILKSSDVFETIRKYRAGLYNYAVSKGTFNVKTIDEFTQMLKKNYEIDNNTTDYSQLTMRVTDGAIVSTGSWCSYKLFVTKDQVKQYITDIAKDRIKNNSYISIQDIQVLDSFGVNFDGYYEKRKEIIEKHNSELLKRIDSKKKEIENTENLLICI
jgi:hypothetical protein